MVKNDNPDIRNAFHKAAELVKSWGQSILPDGRTVAETFTFEGLSFWNAISPMLAFTYISPLLTSSSRQSTNGAFRQTLTQKAKHMAFDKGISVIAGTSGCSHWPSHPAFLFLGFTHNMYRETLQPVAASLARRTDCPIVVIDELLPYQTRMSAHDDAFHSLWQHWDNNVARTDRRLRNLLETATAHVTGKSGLPKIVAENGMEWRAVQPVFDWFFNAYLPRLVKNAAIALHIIEHHRPALLISPDVNDPRTRIFCLAGRLAGIKTLEIHFSFYGINDIEWRFFIADHLAVTGDANLQIMRDHGIPLEKMTVTGSPRYDNAVSWPSELPANVRRDLNIPVGKIMVLFASQPYYFGTFSSPEIRREMIQALFHAASKLDGLILIVKPHPLEDQAELASLVQSGNSIRFVDKKLDIRDLIKASDAFITSFSNTTFDALVMNKPTINLLFPGCCANNLIEHSGATFVARTEDDITRILQSLCNGSGSLLIENLAAARESFLKDWFHKLDGRAAERIEAIALEMTGGSH